MRSRRLWVWALALLTFGAVLTFTVPTNGVGSCAARTTSTGLGGCTQTEFTFDGRAVPEGWAVMDALALALLAAGVVALLALLVTRHIAPRGHG